MKKEKEVLKGKMDIEQENQEDSKIQEETQNENPNPSESEPESESDSEENIPLSQPDQNNQEENKIITE